MGFLSFLDPILDFLFGPLLNFHPFWSILIISFIIALIITLCYKWFTDQDLMKQLKTEIKEFQKQMKELKAHPEKMIAVQKKAMETNMKYMMQSMKPTLVTFIPIILIFGWLNTNLAYLPIMPDQQFNVLATFKNDATGTIELYRTEGLTILSDFLVEVDGGAKETSWLLKGKEGSYVLELAYKGETYNKELLITNEKAYKPPSKSIRSSDLKTISIGNKPLKILKIPGIGWELGWLGTYILFSIIFSMSLRKLFRLY